MLGGWDGSVTAELRGAVLCGVGEEGCMIWVVGVLGHAEVD